MGLIHSLSVLCGNAGRLRQRKGLWSEQISKIAKRFLRFARSSLVFDGEAAELQPEFTLNIIVHCLSIPESMKPC
jgi:hypothetical protein